MIEVSKKGDANEKIVVNLDSSIIIPGFKLLESSIFDMVDMPSNKKGQEHGAERKIDASHGRRCG